MSDPDPRPDDISYRAPDEARKPPQKSRLPSPESRKIDFWGSIVICAIVGAFIDRAFHSWPWGFLIVLALGAAIALLGKKPKS